MSGALTLVTAAPAEPLTLAEARAHLRLVATGSPPSHADDATVTALIQAARETIDGRDGWLGRALVRQTWDLTLADFPPARGRIRIPLPPLAAVASVTYLDGAEASQTLASADYIADTWSQPGGLTPASGSSWPSTADRPDAVVVRFTAGYPPSADSPVSDWAANVPEPIKQAMLLLIGHWYRNREAVIVGQPAVELPLAVEALLMPYRRGIF